MMHYITAYIARKRPEAASFVHELDFARSMSQVPIDLLFNEANILRSWYNQIFQSVTAASTAADEAAKNPDRAAIWNDASLAPFFSRAFAALASADAALADLESQIVAVKALLLQFCKYPPALSSFPFSVTTGFRFQLTYHPQILRGKCERLCSP